MQIRDAELTDVPAIEAVYLWSWRAAYRGLLEPPTLEVEASKRATYDWAAEVRSDSSHVVVAVDGADVVGVAQASDPPGGLRDLPQIEMLYVLESHWGTPVARDLLAEGLRWISERGWTAARLRVQEAQARARRFYEREGWRLDESLAPGHNGYFSLLYYRRELERGVTEQITG